MRSNMAAAAKMAVISVCWDTTLKRRLMPFAMAERRSASERQPVDGLHDVGMHERRLLDDERIGPERHDADAHFGRLLLDERPGRHLGGVEARRLYVVRAHAVRHVDGDDDRRL